MTTRLAEALAPLGNRLPRSVADIEVLRVACHLDGDDFAASMEMARNQVLRWTRKRFGGSLPPEAWDCCDFSVMRGGRNNSAVRILNESTDIWALRAEDLNGGRVWSTEVVIGGKLGERPYFSLRLITSTDEANFSIEPAVPGLILQTLEAPGLVSGGRSFDALPRTIESHHSIQDLCDHLEDPERRLPIFVVTVPDEDISATMIDDITLAKATAGIARVVRVPASHAWVMTDRFGRYRSVFGGAVRAYMPGFSSVDDPYKHRLFLADHLIDPENAAACVAWMRRTAADLSISKTRLGISVLDFTSVRIASLRLQKADLKTRAAPDAEQLSKAAEEVEVLEKLVAEKSAEIDEYIRLHDEADLRAQSAELENRALLGKVRQLESALLNGDVVPSKAPIPQTWSEFIDWIDDRYPDRVVLNSRARRMVKSPEFEDVAQVARAVAWLATDHFELRTKGGTSLRDLVIEDGVHNAPCGGDSYETVWQNRRHTVDWHIKSGGNTRDPKKCLRVYYFWADDTQQTVIDYLPAHRTTSAS